VKNPKRLLLLFLKIVLLMTLLWWFFYRENNTLELSVDEVHLQELPATLDGLRIIHLSDLHSKWFGPDQHNLVAMIEKQKPHAVVITGDEVDVRSKDEQPVLTLIRRISPIAPVLHVAGNHETQLPDREGYLERVRQAGAQVLESDSVIVPLKGGEVVFVGLADRGQRLVRQEALEVEAKKAFAGVKPGSFVVLLAHRPELFPHYALLPVNLIFSGHAHGGQIRLPWIGGLYAPGQGLFPRFDSGVYRNKAAGNDAAGPAPEPGPMSGPIMIISRGLGNSVFPQRLFNRPDVRLVILKKE